MSERAEDRGAVSLARVGDPRRSYSVSADRSLHPSCMVTKSRILLARRQLRELRALRRERKREMFSNRPGFLPAYPCVAQEYIITDMYSNRGWLLETRQSIEDDDGR